MKNINDISTILGLEPGEYNLTQIKEIYRALAAIHHPDKGGDTNKMQLINSAYDDLKEHFKTSETLSINDTLDTPFDFAVFDKLKGMVGLVIEICGYWIWLSGNTIQHKESLKELGFKYSKTKKMWYWGPSLKNSKVRGSKTIKKIRKLFGSKIISNEDQEIILLS